MVIERTMLRNQKSVDDVGDTVREENVGLDDLSGDIAKGDEVTGRIQNEVELLACCGSVVVCTGKERRVQGSSVDDLLGR